MLMQPPPEPPAILWTTPDRNPYRGTRAEAIALMGMPSPPAAMQCRLREVSDGERFDEMTFGRRGVEFNVVADTARWPASASRWADDCMYISEGREWHLIRPLVCGNWSAEWFPIGTGRVSAPGGEWSEAGWSSAGGTDTAGGLGAAWGYGGAGTGAFLSGPGFVSPGENSGFAAAPYVGSMAYDVELPGQFLTGLPSGTTASPPIGPPGTPSTPAVPTPEPGSLAVLLMALALWGGCNLWRRAGS